MSAPIATGPIHTLRSPDGYTTIHFAATDDPDCMLVQWHTIDDGDAETGPSSRGAEEPMCKADARDHWREAVAEGYTRA